MSKVPKQWMIFIEDLVSKARNMHNDVKNDQVAAMSHLRLIFKSRQKNKEAKAAFQSELEKTMKQAGGRRKCLKEKSDK